MVIRYILCFILGFAGVFLTMPPFIEYLKKLSLRQTVSEYSLEEDQKKAGTPIMGGVLFILFPIIVTLAVCFRQSMNLDSIVVMLAFAGYGLIGFIDDWLIAIRKNNEGLTPAKKFIMQLVLAVVFFMIYRTHARLEVDMPFGGYLYLGHLYFVLVLFMFTGSSNAVNLTDGMDGLAAGCSVIALVPFLVICLHQNMQGPAALCFALIGSLLAYLYYNKKPARVFMGDTGALALGGILAGLAMITKTELLLIVIGGIFVIETLCVIIQQVSVRTVHKRVFIYTPIHYAFRLKGMPETSVVKMFWAAELLFALIGLFIYL
ncbi:MAG: phospho-N-acetylmuramoyl-pentapeptide-transferase [Solobacterium sp.]|nr:phospho-N-acetylmuramoyl-pentapeptide-transferase [Solobacterium sp.]